MDRFGVEEVENFIDACLTIEDLIDIHSPFIQRYDAVDKYDFHDATDEEDADDPAPTGKFQSKDYMDSFINPRKALDAERDRQRKNREAKANFPPQPMHDVMLFLLEHADLKPWQYDVLSIIRDEAYYFAPQGQTKIMNEGWASLAAGSLVLTDGGLIPIERVASGEASRVCDGDRSRSIVDRVRFADRATVTIHTRRGIVVTGSTTHRVRMPGGSWKRLDELSPGETVELAQGTDVWPKGYVEVEWNPQVRTTLRDLAAQLRVPAHVVYDYRRGRPGRHSERVEATLLEFESAPATAVLPSKRRALRIPRVVNEDVAAFLGYLIGDGHISVKKRTIGLTTGDDEQAERFSELATSIFGVSPRTMRDGGRWRVKFSSQNLQDFLIHLGLKTGRAAREKTIPDCVLRSPSAVVASFLRALYDCDGYAGKAGVILLTTSDKMSEVVQLLLLNFGAISSRRKAKDGCWQVRVFGLRPRFLRNELGLTWRKASGFAVVFGRTSVV